MKYSRNLHFNISHLLRARFGAGEDTFPCLLNPTVLIPMAKSTTSLHTKQLDLKITSLSLPALVKSVDEETNRLVCHFYLALKKLSVF